MKLSVVIVTYNHAKYIAQAIDSVLMQKVDFDYEILIGEDESSDGTREICLDYAKKHPNTIKVFLRSRKDVIYINGNPTGKHNFIKTLKQAKGKYIALCDGDDYWTDPLKLQKQVDFLEANEDFALCHHNMQVIYEESPEKDHLSNSPRQKEVTTITDLAKGNYIYTASCVFRRYDYVLPEWYHHVPVGDYPLHLLNARYGKIKYLKEVMGSYRIHNRGIWGQRDQKDILLKWSELLNNLIGIFSEDVNKVLLTQQINILRRYFTVIDTPENSEIQLYPGPLKMLVDDYSNYKEEARKYSLLLKSRRYKVYKRLSAPIDFCIKKLRCKK